jgi:two-component system, chemotaxis family, response regulator Rcp1
VFQARHQSGVVGYDALKDSCEDGMDEIPVKRFILIIESNPQQAGLIETVLNQRDGRYDLRAIADSREALDFLHRRGAYQEAARPDLILLDLNVLEQQGKDFLAEIKASPHLKRIPIILLTTASTEADVLTAYTLQSNCYVIKPSDLDHLGQVVKHIEDFWLEIVTLPLE